MREAAGIITGTGVRPAETLVYGSRNPDARGIDGPDVRYRDLDNTRNVFSFTGAAGTMPTPANKCAGPYIRGLGDRGDHGYGNRLVENGGYMPAHAEYFITQFGLAIEHPDAVKRIRSIPADGSLDRDDRGNLRQSGG
jgi:hypothetical protein